MRIIWKLTKAFMFTIGCGVVIIVSLAAYVHTSQSRVGHFAQPDLYKSYQSPTKRLEKIRRCNRRFPNAMNSLDRDYKQAWLLCLS